MSAEELAKRRAQLVLETPPGVVCPREDLHLHARRLGKQAQPVGRDQRVHIARQQQRGAAPATRRSSNATGGEISARPRSSPLAASAATIAPNE